MDELIKSLRICSRCDFGQDCNGCTQESDDAFCCDKLLRQAADAIEQLSADLDRSIDWAGFWQEEAGKALKKFQTTIAHIEAMERLNKQIDYLQKQVAYWQAKLVESMCGELLAESEKPRWIPVTERLPVEKINPNTHDFEYILCATIWGDVRPFKYGTPIGRKDAHFWNGAGYVDAYVTHWMPIPEPPKEKI